MRVLGAKSNFHFYNRFLAQFKVKRLLLTQQILTLTFDLFCCVIQSTASSTLEETFCSNVVTGGSETDVVFKNSELYCFSLGKKLIWMHRDKHTLSQWFPNCGTRTTSVTRRTSRLCV